MTAPTVMVSSTEVASAWLKAVSGAPVATSLPSQNSWTTSGFVTFSVVGGVVNADLPVRRPAVSIDVWANALETKQPPWGRANSLTEAIFRATYDRTHAQVALEVFGQNVHVFSPSVISEPLRVPDNTAGYAHVSFTLELPWVAL